MLAWLSDLLAGCGMQFPGSKAKLIPQDSHVNLLMISLVFLAGLASILGHVFSMHYHM